jgi:hypothetical protein
MQSLNSISFIFLFSSIPIAVRADVPVLSLKKAKREREKFPCYKEFPASQNMISHILR